MIKNYKGAKNAADINTIETNNIKNRKIIINFTVIDFETSQPNSILNFSKMKIGYEELNYL